MNLGRTGAVLARAKAAGRAALITYLPVGYPTVAGSLEAFRLAAQYADLVEIGMPYTDPMMDGTVIQRATTAALAKGVRTKDVFRAVETVTGEGTAAVVMSYWNLVERYGVAAYARDLAGAGGGGVITPDLIPDEAYEWMAASDDARLDRIFLIAPSSTDERLRYTLDACRGWVYATSVMGVTGTREASSQAAPIIVARARRFTDLPIGVGLGVSTPDQAAEVGAYADGVIVGSALVRTLAADGGGLGALEAMLAELAEGVRRAH